MGGLDDPNILDRDQHEVWHSNYDSAIDGRSKPKLVAPSLWVVAPMLPGSGVATEAAALFARRAAGDALANERIMALKLVTPHYQHVEGTSFAAPLIASIVACMLEANPDLSPTKIRQGLLAGAYKIAGATDGAAGRERSRRRAGRGDLSGDAGPMTA